jgi:transcriptional regulator with XRE-family HTH domain
MRVHNLKGLRTLMVVREVSQRRLARAAGYRSHSYLGRILRGEVDSLTPEAAVRIARFLQVSVDWLFAPSPGETADPDRAGAPVSGRKGSNP